MNNKMYKLTKPHITEQAIEEVVKVLKSGNLVQGQKVAEFEAEISKYIGTKHAICVSSGTAALHLSLIALGIGQGDEVIVPAFTFPATANVVEVVGAKTVLVDINLNDFSINADKIEQKITKNTKAIIPVHEFGQAAEIDKIQEIAQKYNLKIIEDAACAFGTEYKWEKVGNFGHLACFSFHPRKAITTGEGGVVVTNSDELADKIRALRNHGIVYHNDKPDFIYAGLNYRMTDFQAVLGLQQLKDIENDIKHRLQLVRIYDVELHDNSSIIKIPFHLFDTFNVYQTYHIFFIDKKIDRNQIIRKLKEKDVETNYGAQALNCLTYYQQKYGYKAEDFPVATSCYNYGLALPMGRHLTQQDVREICKIILETI